jgi:hypothetical protein
MPGVVVVGKIMPLRDAARKGLRFSSAGFLPARDTPRRRK